MSTNRPERLTLLAYLVSTLFGGSNAIAVQYSNAELPPFFGAAVRFGLAALILFAVMLALRLALPTGRALVGAAVYGVLQFGLSYALVYWSLLQVPPGLFQVVLALVPLLTFFFAVAHRQEPFAWRLLAGGLLTVVGIAIIFRDQISANVPLPALLAIVAAAACFAEATVLIKAFPRTHPITTNAVSMGVGGAILFALSAAAREAPFVPAQASTWLALLYLVMLGSIGLFVLALYVLRRWTASATSYQLVLMPIVTLVLSAWLTGERLTPVLLAGAGLVLAGVYVGALAPPEWFQRARLVRAADKG